MLIDGNLDVTGDLTGGVLAPGAYNVAVKYTGGTGEFKLVQADGTDFSTSTGSRGYIVMASTTNGLIKRLAITAATHKFIDDAGSSNIVGEEFGTTAGVAWGSVRPFYLYAVNYDDTDSGLIFAISPNPRLVSTPSSGTNISYFANPMSSPSDSGMFFFTSTNVTATHTSKPALLIGSIRMTKSSADDWTVATISSNVGIGKTQFYETFTMPTGQMGAASGKYFKDNGGTAPTYTATSQMEYMVDPNGFVTIQFVFENSAGGTAGSGSVSLQLAAPYVNAFAASQSFCGAGTVSNSGSIASIQGLAISASSTTISATIQDTLVTSINAITNVQQNNASRGLQGVMRYRAFA